MINITDTHNCCGCGACTNICPRQCIVLKKDDTEGFLYPEVDASVCCHCDACERVCPMLNNNESHKPLQVIAGRNEDDIIRKNSSSGGIFSSLAEHIISKGGVVFGVRFSDDFRNAVFCEVDDAADITVLRGSKYLQAEANEVYKQVRLRLREGRPILFSGTPCQVRALRLYLGKEANSSMLYCVDIICHGVPSPEVWRQHLHNIIGEKRPTSVFFRDKRIGWKDFSIVITTESGEYCRVHRDDLYMQSFLRNVNLRPSCYKCSAKNGRSGADLTIGDFWGIPSDVDDDQGASQILVTSSHGAALLNEAQIHGTRYPESYVQQHNTAYYASVGEPSRRKYFWRLYKKYFAKAVKCSTEYQSPIQYVKSYLRNLLFYNLL